MLSNRFRQCQWNERMCYSRRPSPTSLLNVQPIHARLVSHQSFPHLWKKLWKNHRNRRLESYSGPFSAGPEWGETAQPRRDGRFRRRRPVKWDKTAGVARRSSAEGVFAEEMNLWDQILARIETRVNRHSFYTWFKPTTFVAEDRGSVTVRVPNALFKD